MAINYSWDFDSLEVTYSSASMDNVVTNVQWQYEGTTEGTSSLGVTGSFHAREIGIASLDKVASADFVAYESLTEEIVTGWVTASISAGHPDRTQTVSDLQYNISSSISRLLNPDTGNKSVPW